MSRSLPIAIVDSGAGGLSVAHALRRSLPRENICYYGDTANLPYGLKSSKLIRELSMDLAQRAVVDSCAKLLVVACHTISALCLDDLQRVVSVPVIGMVEPTKRGLKNILRHHPYKSIGILSTNATYSSHVYRHAWADITDGRCVELMEYPCGILVSLVEEVDLLSTGDLSIILTHVLPSSLRCCEGLVLGCTHFSALKDHIQQMLPDGATVIDGADFVADEVQNRLNEMEMFKTTGTGWIKAKVTDNPDRFKVVARRFITEELSMELF